MDALSLFSADYPAARAKFLEAARSAGASLHRHENPAVGPEGSPLTTDVAVLGPEDAKVTLMVTSGTHGAEGFFGSAVQVAWLRSRGLQALPPDLKVVLVHAINPFGFAWLRRTNEDNIDINRNFIDHEAGHPANPGYQALHEAILPTRWDEESQQAYEQATEAFVAEHGQRALEAAITAGQYSQSEGLFYGGEKPCWSNRLIHSLAEKHAAAAEAVIFIDLHTGLGSWGYIETIHRHPAGSPGEDWLKRHYGSHSLGSLARGDSASTASSEGLLEVGVARALPGKRIYACALEAGTRPVAQVLGALRADNWLHIHGDLHSQQGKAMKAAMKEAFCPPEVAWKELVLLRCRQILDGAMAGAAEA